MKSIFRPALAFFLAAAFMQGVSAAGGKTDRIRVVATTTLISSIVQEIGRDKVEVITIIPGGMCPGHFDLAPGTAKQAADSHLFIYHGWEKWAENMLSGINSSRTRYIRAGTEGNWMVPPLHRKAAAEIEKAVSETDKKNSGCYKANLKRYCAKIENASARLKKRFQKHHGKTVVCSEMQREFLEWLGLKVAGSYPRAEDMNIKSFSELVSLAKREKAQLVIDNLQSGPDTGREIAKDLKIGHVVLTNFPPGASYLDAMESNARELEKGLK